MIRVTVTVTVMIRMCTSRNSLLGLYAVLGMGLGVRLGLGLGFGLGFGLGLCDARLGMRSRTWKETLGSRLGLELVS